MRHVCFFTGSRADYGLLSPVMREAQAAGMRVSVLACGAHLSERFGHTVDEIEADGFTDIVRVPTLSDTDSATAVCASAGRAMEGLSKALEELRPDVLVLLGDRYETLAAAFCAQVLRLPVAHLHGGECSFGAMDEAFRHSITKMSHLHFASTEEYARRIVQLGEDPERVFHVGAPGVETALNVPLMPEAQVRGDLGLKADEPYILATFHPVTLDSVAPELQLKSLLGALEDLNTASQSAGGPGYAVVFTGANADTGGDAVNRRLAAWAQIMPERRRLFASLGQRRYLSAVRHAAAVVGNSSSGIIEVPSLSTPVVDIGDRQLGRARSEAVVHCEPEREHILAALTLALSPEHAKLAAKARNPYELQGTAHRIAQVLARTPLGGLMKKTFHDLPAGGSNA